MKNTRFFFLLLFGCFFAHGQTHSESIADAVVTTQKGTINGMLIYELTQRNLQGTLLKALEETEERYNSKRKLSPTNASTNALIIYAAQNEILSLERKIADIKSNIAVLKIASFGIGHGLSRYQSLLEREETYLKKIKDENSILLTGLVIAGGTGHVYTSYLKLLIRLSPIKNNILKINKEIKTKMTVTRILSR